MGRTSDRSTFVTWIFSFVSFVEAVQAFAISRARV